MKPAFLTAEWRNLVMINYEIDPDRLSNYLPKGTELDARDGIHLISLVGFQFLNTRVKGIRIPFHVNFEEVNLRFYVKRKWKDGWRRGVVFISELVPKPAIALVANMFYYENYHTVKMRCRVHGRTGINVHYEWKWANRWNKIFFHSGSPALALTPGSIEEFITEHYWGYNRVSASKSTEYQVEHPRWNTYQCDDFSVDCDFGLVYGNDFEFLNRSPVHSVFMAEGSGVKVGSGISFH